MKEHIEKIDEYSKDWAIEFSEILKLEEKPEYAAIISLAMITALYRIADKFFDKPEIRNLILSKFGVNNEKS